MSTAASLRGFTQLPVARAKLLEDKKKRDRETGKTSSGLVALQQQTVCSALRLLFWRKWVRSLPCGFLFQSWGFCQCYLWVKWAG